MAGHRPASRRGPAGVFRERAPGDGSGALRSGRDGPGLVRGRWGTRASEPRCGLGGFSGSLLGHLLLQPPDSAGPEVVSPQGENPRFRTECASRAGAPGLHDLEQHSDGYVFGHLLDLRRRERRDPPGVDLTASHADRGRPGFRLGRAAPAHRRCRARLPLQGGYPGIRRRHHHPHRRERRAMDQRAIVRNRLDAS